MPVDIEDPFDYFVYKFMDALIAVVVTIIVLQFFEPMIRSNRLYASAIYDVLTRR